MIKIRKKFLDDPNIIINKELGIFGRLTLLYKFFKNNRCYGHCICECGNECDVLFDSLGRSTISCGCYHIEMQHKIRTDLTNRKFGLLTAIKRIKKENGIYYLCKCDCGKEVTVLHNNLITGNTKSCGCSRKNIKHHNNEEFTKPGIKYGRYTSLGIIERRNKRIYLKCRCECGTEQFIRLDAIRNGSVKSCGCYAKESGIKRLSFLLDENAMHWKGGYNDKGYCHRFMRKSFRERVRKFFEDKCVLCGKTKEENGKRLLVHHVYSNKQVMCSEDERKYFVPLCYKCHGKVHSGEHKGDFSLRDYFVKLIDEKGGKCWYTIEEYLEKYKHVRLSNE